MNIFRKADQLRSSELNVARRGFWKPDYFFTDGQFDYGRMTCVSFSSCEKAIETADATYTIKKAGRFSKQRLILKNGEVIGKVTENAWKCVADLELNDGFKASFTRTPGRRFFSTNLSWIANGVELMMIACRSKYSKPMTATIIDKNIANQTERLLLLAFIGVNIRLIRQAQAAVLS